MQKKELTKFLRKNLNMDEFRCVYQFMCIDDEYADGEFNMYADHTLEYFVKALLEMTLDCASETINDSYNYSIESLAASVSIIKTLLIAARKLTRALKQPKEEE